MLLPALSKTAAILSQAISSLVPLDSDHVDSARSERKLMMKEPNACQDAGLTGQTLVIGILILKVLHSLFNSNTQQERKQPLGFLVDGDRNAPT